VAEVAVQRRVDAVDDLVDVVDAAAQVIVVHALEHRGQAVALQAQGIVGRIVAVADQVVEAMQQFRVVEQQRVQVEEFADLLRQCAMQARAQAVHFGADDADRVVQSFEFGIDVVDPFLGDLQYVRQANPGPPQRAAARGPLAGQLSPHQPSSSNRRAKSSAMASAAAASSSPSTRSSTGVPWPAASSITPMMLLALTSRPLADRVAVLR